MIYVKDLSRMTAFYGQTLGLKRVDDGRYDSWVEFDAGGARVALHAIPAEMQANGLAPVEPASLTVEVEGFCPCSACKMKMRSIARASTGSTSYSSRGTAKHMCKKFAE